MSVDTSDWGVSMGWITDPPFEFRAAGPFDASSPPQAISVSIVTFNDATDSERINFIDPRTVARLLTELAACDSECTAGPLANHVAWRRLRELAGMGE